MAVTKLLQSALESKKTQAKCATLDQGPHPTFIIGHDRTYGNRPILTAWHLDHETEVLEFIKTPVIQEIDLDLSSCPAGISWCRCPLYQVCQVASKKIWNYTPFWCLLEPLHKRDF